MAEQYLLKGKVLWCYGYELQQANLADEFRGMMSFTMPLHYHEGEIVLTQSALYIQSDSDIQIRLDTMQQLYMGFDEQYRRTYAKNGGLFWQPLRISYAHNMQLKTIYLIIDLNWFTVSNSLWFNTLKSLF